MGELQRDAGASTRPVGLPGWELWSNAVPVAAKFAPDLFPGVPARELREIAALRVMMEKRVPSPKAVAAQAAKAVAELDAWLGSLQVAEDRGERMKPDTARKIAHELAKGTLTPDRAKLADHDWDSLAASYLGCVAMHNATSSPELGRTAPGLARRVAIPRDEAGGGRTRGLWTPGPRPRTRPLPRTVRRDGEQAMTQPAPRIPLMATFFAVGVALALGLGGSNVAPGAQKDKDYPKPPAGTKVELVGAAICQDCHGNEDPTKKKVFRETRGFEFVRLSENLIWEAHDLHSTAYKNLLTENSIQGTKDKPNPAACGWRETPADEGPRLPAAKDTAVSPATRGTAETDCRRPPMNGPSRRFVRARDRLQMLPPRRAIANDLADAERGAPLPLAGTRKIKQEGHLRSARGNRAVRRLYRARRGGSSRTSFAVAHRFRRWTSWPTRASNPGTGAGPPR